MTDLRDARLTDVLPKAVADQQEAKSLSDAWHDLTVLILDFADNQQDHSPNESLLLPPLFIVGTR